MTPNPTDVIGIAELAKIIHRAESTIATEVTKCPNKLPPRLRLPASRRVLWLRSDVNAWIADHREV